MFFALHFYNYIIYQKLHITIWRGIIDHILGLTDVTLWRLNSDQKTFRASTQRLEAEKRNCQFWEVLVCCL